MNGAFHFICYFLIRFTKVTNNADNQSLIIHIFFPYLVPRGTIVSVIFPPQVFIHNFSQHIFLAPFYTAHRFRARRQVALDKNVRRVNGNGNPSLRFPFVRCKAMENL